jgi:alpha-L-rhamnosidase
VALTGALLGRADDAAHFRALAERTRAAFTGHYVSPDGSIQSDAITCYARVRCAHRDRASRRRLPVAAAAGMPSWLYPVTMGATTIWERWDSMLPDGRINPGEMTSFNHYALGAVADWLHRVVGGIEPAEPGYRTVRIAPRPGGGLTWAETSLDTSHGRIRHLAAGRLRPA